MTDIVMRACFDPGRIVATATVQDKINRDYALAALAQHLRGNWGLVDEEDWKTNDHALKHGGRILSSYPMDDSAEEFWIITEGDRSVTTILLPSDY